VAFAPGTVIGSGGTAPPAPTIVAAENTLAAAFGDPTNRSLGITVGDSNYSPSQLTVTVRSSNPTVAPTSGITVTGSGASRTLSRDAGGRGHLQADNHRGSAGRLVREHPN